MKNRAHVTYNGYRKSYVLTDQVDVFFSFDLVLLFPDVLVILFFITVQFAYIVRSDGDLEFCICVYAFFPPFFSDLESFLEPLPYVHIINVLL